LWRRAGKETWFLVLALDCHLLVGYFPIKFPRYFDLPKNGVTQWNFNEGFCALDQDCTIVYLLSRDSVFLWCILDTLAGCQRVIVTVEFICCLALRPIIQGAAKAVEQLLAELGLRLLMVGDSGVGGVNNGWHLLCFGSDLGSAITPMAEPDLHCTLHHFLDGGVYAWFPSVMIFYPRAGHSS
jgi:hypothetical protein